MKNSLLFRRLYNRNNHFNLILLTLLALKIFYLNFIA